MEKIKALIVKIGGNMCNLKCKYCFYCNLDQQKQTIMSKFLLEDLIKQSLKIEEKRVHFIWHGGEPLLCGIDYFYKIVEYQKKYKKADQKIRNSLQTNGILLNEEWLSFFKEYNFYLGISIDGDRESHNVQRIFPSGEGSFDYVVRSIKLMQQKNFNFGVIQVLTKQNLERCDKIFDFFAKEIKLQKWAINQMCYVLKNGKISDDSITNQEYYSYIKRTFDMWLEYDKSYLSIREIDNLLSGVYKFRPNNCSYNGTCGQYLCIDYNGDVYPCDRFSSNQKFLFGNLTKQSLLDIVLSKNRQQFISEINSPYINCIDCEKRRFCNNGCPHHREGGISGGYVYCQSRQRLYDYFSEIKVDIEKERR